MTYQDISTDTDDKALEIENQKKPWHVRLVSIGSFILLTVLVLFIVVSMTETLVGWLSFTVMGLPEGDASFITMIYRNGGLALLGASLFLALFKKQFYNQRVVKLLKPLLLIGLAIFFFFAFGIGLGIIFVFMLFLWNPKQFAHWSNQQMDLYRGVVVGSIGIWIVLEGFLSEAATGTTILPAVLSVPLNSTLGEFSLIATFILIPTYMILPKVIESIWNYRKSIESFWREFVHERMGLVGLAIIGAIVGLALIAPLLEGAGLIRNWGDLTGGIGDNMLLPPSAEYPLGTNHIGQDILSRLIFGTQISLIVGFTASIVAVSLGTTVGLISGYYGGAIDTILMRITDVFLSLPTLPLMLVFLVMFGQGLQNIIFVIAILGWTGTARMVRSEALSLRERPLTEAAHALGASDRYILIKHILPNTLPLILANMILGVVGAILGEAGIAFLGFVDIHGQPSWGIMLHWANKNAALLNSAWWWIIPPGLLILLTSLGFVFMSHAADKVVNPRLRGRRS